MLERKPSFHSESSIYFFYLFHFYLWTGFRMTVFPLLHFLLNSFPAGQFMPDAQDAEYGFALSFLAS